MKIAVNNCYGIFNPSDEAMKFLADNGASEYTIDHPDSISGRETLAGFIEQFGSERASGRLSRLEVAELPEGTTDWMTVSHEGLEHLYYVLNGKIHYYAGFLSNPGI